MALTNKVIVDNILTSAQSAQIGLEALTNKVEDLGGSYNSTVRKNTSLKDSFTGYGRTIVNAINSLDNKDATLDSSVLNLVNLLNQTIGDIQKDSINQANKKLQALFGDKPIVTGLLDYYTNGLGFNSTNFRGLYKEYTQAELNNGAVDLIPLNSTLNVDDIIKDENGVYYKIISQALVNKNGIKPTIDELRRQGAIDDNWEVKSDGIIFRGQYNPGEEYKKNDLFYHEKQIGIDPYQEIVDVFYLVTKDGTAPLDLNDFSSNIIAINDKAEIKSDVDELKNKLGNLSFSAFGQSIKNATDAINDLNTKITNLEKGKIDLQIIDGDLVEFKNKELVDSGVKVEDLIFQEIFKKRRINKNGNNTKKYCFTKENW